MIEETANRLEKLRLKNERDNRYLRQDTEALLDELQNKKGSLNQTTEKFAQ